MSKLCKKIKKINYIIFKDIFSPIFTAIIIALFLKIFVLNIFYIPSSSMEDTIKIGDIVIVWKFLYDCKIPLINLKFPFGFKVKHNDIIVFLSPENKSENYVKRCIAIESDYIKLTNNKVILNNKVLNENYVKFIDLVNYEPQGLKIPPETVFVMGDNRLNSYDSRNFGPVPKKNIIGKVILIIYPFNRIKLLK